MTEGIKITGRWFSDNRLSLIAIIGNIAFVVYLAIVRENDIKNNVQTHEARLNSIEIQIGDLREKKVDKETFLLINDNLNALRSDIRDIKNGLMQHLTQDK
jgi:hypothetical protein